MFIPFFIPYSISGGSIHPSLPETAAIIVICVYVFALFIGILEGLMPVLEPKLNLLSIVLFPFWIGRFIGRILSFEIKIKKGE